MKSTLTLILSAIILPLFGANAFAANPLPVYNNRSQLVSTVTRADAAPQTPAPAKKKLVFNNRHQVIAIVDASSR